MEAKKPRIITEGAGYNSYLPKAKLTDTTMKRGATLKDTMQLIPQVVKKCKWQTERLSQLLKGKSVYDTCHHVWDFLYQHVRFHKDDENNEQIRSPARSWHDRARGIDCDCFTVFISTILTNLGIPHTLRITKYGGPSYQHIYPIVPTKDGKHITIDCVTDKFNYEEPFSEKEDTNMDLQFLEGFNEDEKGLSESDLGKKGWFKKFTHNALHALNRVNPATVLLRNGVLAAMKLNMFKVPQRIKYAYWTPQQAQQNGMDMGKYNQLVALKGKLENIFFGAGGKPENFKKAILEGNGNRNHEVSGLDCNCQHSMNGITVQDPLEKILGKELYESENKVEGLGDLGVVATAAIASATAVIAAISEAIKKIGNPFAKKDGKGSDDFKDDPKNDADASAAAKGLTTDQTAMMMNPSSTPQASALPADSTTPDSSSDNGEQPQGFWAKNKKWLKPTLFGTAGVGAVLGGWGLWKHSKKKKKAEKRETLTGTKKHEHKDKKKPVALL